jgi:hypothetical protein
MPSERIQRQIDQHLDAAEEASGRLDWPAVEDHAGAALALDPDNGDATVLLTAARQRLAASIPSADRSAEDTKNAFQASPSRDPVQPGSQPEIANGGKPLQRNWPLSPAGLMTLTFS